jgi:hydroxyacylglutathione hydrolase
MFIRQIMDEKLAQYAFLIGCQQTGEAMLLDPERDVDRYLDLAAGEGLRVIAVAETHIHADFLSGAREIASRVPGLNVYLSAEGGEDWQYEWPQRDGARVTWLHDGTTFRVGNIEFRAWHTPGHTPEHMAFVVVDHGGGAVDPIGMLTGDFVFVGDLGRPDLLESAAGVTGAMEPSARRLYASTRRFLNLPDFMQVWPGHGAGSACGKALGAVPVTTVGYERRVSPAIAATEHGEEAFVDFILADQPEPPLYFANMKRLNKEGPPILGKLPVPRRLSAADVVARTHESDTQIVDTRADRHAFFAGHVPGAFYAPLNKTFPTVIGSLLDPARPIVLLIDEARVEEAVRDLIRIGYDHIEGWAPVPGADELRALDVTPATIETVGFDEFERRRQSDGALVLDVRGATEYRGRHVPGARNIAHTRLRARISEVPADAPVFVHCRTGARSAVAAAFLARQGVPVVNVDGDFAAWEPAEPSQVHQAAPH